ncbi:transient receptor potential cation channel [Trichuris trichiura]|uniref:Transient receptor potential cation channel n=1 Tax=Trichuris trichiura TaxID=36087 RepID=A0A077Z6J1_TRITR|nr:transient receptor potential cation channel [Trichuris trichiura]
MSALHPAYFHFRCGCGRYFGIHYYFEEEKEPSAYKEGYKWNVSDCTAPFSTDAYGTLKFHGVARPWKSSYLRLDYTADPNDIWQLLVHVWGLEPPKLVITIYGGGNDFDLSPALWQEFRNGLLRVANNTSVWVITSGIRVGQLVHCDDNEPAVTSNFALIGIAPWGLIRRAEKLIGSNKCLNYYPFSSQRSRFVSLCEGHNCFLLVDDGTLGRSGAEIAVRRKFEAFLTQKTMNNSSRLMPIVLLMLGGGRLAMHSATECVRAPIPVPVVLCKNSGRAADQSFHTITRLNNFLRQNEEQFKSQLLKRIEETLETNTEELTIFDGLSVINAEEQLDCKILNALLQGRSSSQVDRLSLLLAWNREDMVREMLERGVEWEESALDSVMMQALMHDRIDFVQLLLANGVAIEAFLTPERLEELYNTDKGPPNTLNTLMQDTYSLPDIGLLIEKLMGGGYRSTYRRREFRSRYKQCLKVNIACFEYLLFIEMLPLGLSQEISRSVCLVICTDRVGSYFFENPFNDLFLWAVLTNRLNMAVCMWRQGDEPLAKALVGYKLFKSMAKEADSIYGLPAITTGKRRFINFYVLRREFRKRSNELLEQCYKTDDFFTMQVLTYELKNWGKKNCISLAALGNNKEFIAHPSCQVLLADLWMGGLGIRKNVNLKVLLGVLIPPVIFTLPFKTKEQLLLQAQTAAEFQEHCDPDEWSFASESSSTESDSELKIAPTANDDERATAVDFKNGAQPKRIRRHRKISQYVPSNQSEAASVMIGLAHFRQDLSVQKKIREFYAAPILSYLFFLTCFTYIVLVKATPEPYWAEYYVFAFVLGFFCLMMDAKDLRTKIKVFSRHRWDWASFWGSLSYFVGFGLRLGPQTLELGRVILKVNIMFWYMRLLHVMTVSSRLGPYITIYGKMVSKMVLLCIILFVLLISFGVFRQAITYPNESWEWELVRNIVYKPYFMLYGEVYAGEIDTCGDNDTNCVYFYWLSPLFMTVYLLLSIIVFLNMMIAAFNAHSNLIWKYQKFEQVMDYEQQSFLPPPFVLVVHLFQLGRYCCRRLCRCNKVKRTDLSLSKLSSRLTPLACYAIFKRNIDYDNC